MSENQTPSPIQDTLDEARREQIIQATTRLIEKRGIRSAGVRDIASEGEFAIGAIYRHFENRDALLFEIAKREMEQVTKISQKISRAKNPNTKITHLLTDYCKLSGDFGRARLETELKSYARENLYVYKCIEVAEQTLLNAVKKAIEKGQKKQVFCKELHPKTAATAILAIIKEVCRTPGKSENYKDRRVEELVNKLLQPSR